MLTVLPAATIVNGQSVISSPYSAFGLGNLSDPNNTRFRGMGNLSIGMRDYFTVNPSNPASYSAFDSTSFVFEGAVKGFYNTLETNEISEPASSATLEHLLFGFPVTKWWHSSFGLLPYSSVGYHVTDVDDHPDLKTVKYTFEGEGGLNRVYWGHSIRPVNWLSLGVNASYLFGSINKIQKVVFPDTVNVLGTRVDNSLFINGITFDFGVQYHTLLKNKYNLTIGGVYQPALRINSEKNYMARTFISQISNVDIFRDTAVIVEGLKGETTIPSGYGIGFSLANSYDWTIGFDYRYNNWSGFESFGINDSLQDRHLIHAGGAFIPDRNSLKYFNRVEYRLGGYYENTALKLRDTPINGFGITFGMGLPLKGASARRSKSMLNITLEYGRRGTFENDLIRESYFNVHLGVSVYEWWFFKKRYK
ncbi:MAG: outer membrane protein transport protein [Bacteroidales bacterium]